MRLLSINSTQTRSSTLLVLFTTIKLVASTTFRIVYPFLPAFSRGLGVPFEAVSAAVSARSALGFFGPILGAFADIRGRKKALMVGLILLGLSIGLIGVFPSYRVFFLGMLLSGGATVIIDSSMHAYLGDKIPYEKRGQAMAMVEMGWSLAFIIGIPFMGWIMLRSSWNSPFLLLGCAGLIAGVAVYLFVPRLPSSSESWNELKQGLAGILSLVPVLGLALTLLTVAANQMVSIVFGVWMESSFGMQLEQLGAASSVIGFAGVGGAICAILFTDSLGKRKAIGIGLFLNALICITFSSFDNNLPGTLIVLFLFYLTFEFTLTSLLPLMTTLSTKARGVFMAATIATASLGDSLGSLIGPYLIKHSMTAISGTSAALDLIGLVILIMFVKPKEK